MFAFFVLSIIVVKKHINLYVGEKIWRKNFKFFSLFFLFSNFFQKKCIFLLQKFVISKNCIIFVIQSNTELLTYKNYRYESTRN